MFLRLRLPRHSAYDDTFFWSGECRDNEVRLYKNAIFQEIVRFMHKFQNADVEINVAPKPSL